MCTTLWIFFFIFIKKVKKKMFRINNRTVQNKRTEEKFGPVKIIILYLIRIVQRGNWAKKMIVYVRLFGTGEFEL